MKTPSATPASNTPRSERPLSADFAKLAESTEAMTKWRKACYTRRTSVALSTLKKSDRR
jgi:hypothetical protein